VYIHTHLEAQLRLSSGFGLHDHPASIWQTICEFCSLFFSPSQCDSRTFLTVGREERSGMGGEGAKGEEKLKSTPYYTL
jgi:hypothetical protein